MATIVSGCALVLLVAARSLENDQRVTALSSATGPNQAWLRTIPDEPARLFGILSSAPEWTIQEARRTMVASDEAHTILLSTDENHRSEETERKSMAFLVRERLGEIQVSRAEAMNYFQIHAELFGERSFEQSRHVIEQLVAIQCVREQLDL